MQEGVRVVPGGSSVREGAYLARGVVCMPPMYVNAGAYVDEGTMVDSHALVGSCAQIGKRVHLSAAAQIGGVLEPVNATPVIIEDDVLIGGNTGVYEGTLVRRRAVLAAGTILTGHAGLRYRARGSPQGFWRPAPDNSGRSRGGAGGKRVEARNPRRRAGIEPVHTSHRQISRRQNGSELNTGGSAALKPFPATGGSEGGF